MMGSAVVESILAAEGHGRAAAAADRSVCHAQGGKLDEEALGVVQ